VASREQQGAYLCLSRGNAVLLAHWVGECAMVGCTLHCGWLNKWQKWRRGGTNRWERGWIVRYFPQHAGGLPLRTQKMRKARFGKRRKREERRSVVGCDGARTETDNNKRGGLCNQSGRFSTKRGFVSAERRKLSV